MRSLKKNPEADLALKYRKVLETSLALAILIMVFVFFAFKKFEGSFQLPEQPNLIIESIDIPQTRQLQKPPPPSRPSIPVEVDDDEAMDDVTIEDTDVSFENFEDAPPPPPPEEDEEVYEFFAVSEKPVLLHKEVPKFPDLARKAGIEGTVVQLTEAIDTKITMESADTLKQYQESGKFSEIIICFESSLLVTELKNWIMDFLRPVVGEKEAKKLVHDTWKSSCISAGMNVRELETSYVMDPEHCTLELLGKVTTDFISRLQPQFDEHLSSGSFLDHFLGAFQNHYDDKLKLTHFQEFIKLAEEAEK